MRIVVAALAIVVLAGCGSGVSRTTAPEWTRNAGGVVSQLRADIVELSGADSRPVARRALRDDSQLYGLLVAFSDVAGCNHMVGALGTAPPGRARVVALLGEACAHLSESAALFTKAVAQKNARLLVAAAVDALAALAPIDRADLRLRARQR